MYLRSYIPFHHEKLVKQWWESRQNIEFPARLLSDTGMVAYHESRPVAAAFLYLTNSKVAWIGWPISDPESDAEVRSEALNAVFENLQSEARRNGHELIFTISGIPALQKRLEGLGYVVADEGINQYFKELV